MHAFAKNDLELTLGEIGDVEGRLDELKHSPREKRLRDYLWRFRV